MRMKGLFGQSRKWHLFFLLILLLTVLRILFSTFMVSPKISTFPIHRTDLTLSMPAELYSMLAKQNSLQDSPDPNATTCFHNSFVKLTEKDQHNPDDYFTPSTHPIGWEVSQFLIQPRQNICSSHLDLLMLVPSSPDNEKKREAIRNTWGSVASGKQWPHGIVQSKVGVVFLMGQPVTAAVESEAKARGDILLADLHDTFRNLTWKMLAGLKWVSTHCSDTTFVGKIDDDMFMNVDLSISMLNLWLNKSGNVHSVLGGIICSDDSVVIRKNRSRYYVNESDYPFSSYPPYVSGGHYTLSSQLVPHLVSLSRHMPVLPVEDAYINGVLAHMLDVQHVRLPQVLKMNAPPPETFVNSCYLSAHGFSVERMEATWNSLKQQSVNCSEILSVQNLNTCSQFCKRHIRQ